MKADYYNQLINKSVEAQKQWRSIPAPARGDLIRHFGNNLRKNLMSVGKGVTRESKKLLVAGIGEVQEVIVMCDFAV